MKKTIQNIKVDLPNGRVETGSLKFNDDWTGVFIRGDNAVYYSMIIGRALRTLKENNIEDFMLISGLEGIRNLLNSSNENLTHEKD